MLRAQTASVRARRGTEQVPASKRCVVPVLIFHSKLALGSDWAVHLARLGLHAVVTDDPNVAFAMPATGQLALAVIDLGADPATGFALSDYAAIRQPRTRVMLVTPRLPWADARLLIHVRNACALVGQDTPPEDLAAMACYHATAARI